MCFRLQRLNWKINHIAGQIGRRLIRWAERDSNCLRHARDEWAIAFPDSSDPMQSQMGEHVLDMVAMFALEGHSGSSASYAQKFIEKALRFEPFSPLTGADSEWAEPHSGDGTQQNKRCGRIFRGNDGKAYDIEGRVFEDSESRFTSRDSRVYITFPYVPKTEIVKIEEPSS